MQPQPEDTSINLPITFDYRGGRNENKRNKWITFGVVTIIAIIVIIGVAVNSNIPIWKRFVIDVVIFYVCMLFIRYIVFKEPYYSDIYETLKEMNFILPVGYMWKIFDVDYEYPYIAYFKNGMKGIFVKMEKSAVTGKGSNACFNHYEAISEALRKAHSLNMDIRHIDYMDNVGNDSRLQNLYDNLKDVTNPDMEDILIDIYANLREEMSLNYASFDIYVFLTRDKIDTFVFNMQQVCNSMLGGNFITYRVLNRADLSSVCMALFNLHKFSVVDACESVLKGESHRGIVPIRLLKEDGTIEKINKTQEEKRIEAREQARRKREAELEQKAKKRNKKKKSVDSEETAGNDNDDLNLFE